jgi:hypothetical protein
LGFVQRQQGFDPVPFIATLLFALPPRGPVSRAFMWRAYQRRAGQRLARSAFYARFNRGLGKLVEWLLDQLIQRARTRGGVFTGVLAGFRDVVAVDATVVALHPSLRNRWKATGEGKAALKVHTRVRATTGEILRAKISPAVHHDSKHFGVNWKDAGKLFLLDQAYCSRKTWFRIARIGAFFVTRLPISFKTTIERSLRPHRGRARDVVGLPIWEALEQIERQVLDVECPFRVRIGRYRSKRGRWETHHFRVVAVRNEADGEYHVYVTNIPTERLSAENIWSLYRLRWEVDICQS